MNIKLRANSKDDSDVIFFDNSIHGGGTATWFFANAVEPEPFVGVAGVTDIYSGDKVILGGELYIASLMPVLICEDEPDCVINFNKNAKPARERFP